MGSEPIVPSAQLRELLRGFPERVVAACAEFQAAPSSAAFERAFAGVIEHHLPQERRQAVGELTAGTRLVEDLGLDSMTMVEMAFLFEDVFGQKVPHEEYVKITTLGELRALLRSRIGLAASP